MLKGSGRAVPVGIHAIRRTLPTTLGRVDIEGRRLGTVTASRRASRHHRDTVQAINDGKSAFEAKALSPSPGALI